MHGKTISSVALAVAATVAVAACGGSSGATTTHAAAQQSGSPTPPSTSSTTSSTATASANGVAQKSPRQILNAAVNAANSAKSVRVQGTLKDGTQPITLDLSLVSGKGASGTIAEGPASFKLVETSNRFYMQPNPAFLKKFTHSDAGAKLLEGKWLSGSSTGSQFRAFAQLTSIKTLMQGLVKGHLSLTKGGTSTVDGQPAVAIHDTVQGGTLYVATTGQPYPLQVSQSGSMTGKISFTQYNQPLSVVAPKNSISIDQLGSGASGS